MSKKPKRPEQAVAIDDIRELLARLRSLFPTLTRPAAKKTMAGLFGLMDEIAAARAELDPIKDPGASFDPTNPDTAGRLVALALVAQDKVPLGRVARTYGSGVYAIYYHGDYPYYAPLSGTETPIYVGKADPKQADAKTSREQGPQLFGRLADHRKMIKTVGAHAIANSLPHPLRVEDFYCRRLVCATNAQYVAERHLIGTFKPIWNQEMQICWGISKHGDAADTRGNSRSPWDVLHPGRKWAMAPKLLDKMPSETIHQKIRNHFALNPPHKSRGLIVRTFLLAFVQHAAMTPEEAATTGYGDEMDESGADASTPE